MGYINKHKRPTQQAEDRIQANQVQEGLESCEHIPSVYAFANDFDDLGGGYVVVGVDTTTRVAIHPVEGIRLMAFFRRW